MTSRLKRFRPGCGWADPVPALRLVLAVVLCGCAGLVGAPQADTRALSAASSPKGASEAAAPAGNESQAGAASAVDAPGQASEATSEANRTPGERLDLASLHKDLRGSIVVPVGAKNEVRVDDRRDNDGFRGRAFWVRIADGTVGLTDDEVGQPQYASPEAMVAFRRQRRSVSTHRFSPDHWAVVSAWDARHCMIDGVHRGVGLTCGSFKVPCEEVPKWLAVCESLRPGDAPNAHRVTPTSTFPKIAPEAAQVAWDVAHGVVHNDVAGLVRHLPPQGLRIGSRKRRLSADQLTQAAKASSVVDVVSPWWVKSGNYDWSWAAYGDDSRIMVPFIDVPYGTMATFSLKNVKGRWWLDGFVVEDFGEH